jgi:hypothetical protein
MEILVPISILVGFGLVYWWASAKEKKRREKLIEMAQSLGLEISWALDPQDAARFRRFDVANKGHTQNVKMVLCADTGETRMVVFDYEYIVGHGKHRVQRIFSMVLCIDARFKAPKMSMQPESWSTAIAALVGARDIDFKDDPDFSSAFQLSGVDEQSVRLFMNESRRKAFLANPQIRLEVDGDALLVMQPHFRLTAESVRTYMAQALAAVQIIIDEPK